MAGELKLNWPITDTLFTCVFNTAGKIWYPTGQAFETFGISSRTASNYAIVMTGYTGGIQLGDMDTNIPAGNYIALFYIRSTSTPLDADMADSVGKQDLYWTGSIVSTEIVSASPITKASILTFVNSRLNRSETDIDESIKIVLGDLSALKTLLVEDTSQSLTISDNYLPYPSDALMDDHSIKSVKLTDSSDYVIDALKVIEDGWPEYLILSRTTERSVPQQYITNANRIYFDPAPNGTYAASIWYFKRHSEDPDDIDFDIDWKNTIYFGVTAEVALHRKVPAMEMWTARYEREKQRMKLIKQ